MIKWLFKYGVVIYLLNTILLSIQLTFSIGYNIFLGIMGIYIILLLINPKQVKLVLLNKSFNFLLFLTVLNFLYWILFDDITNVESLKYLFARAIQFSIIPLSIYHNFEYYKDKFFTHLIYIVFFIIVAGLFINPYLFAGRYGGLIWNPNMLASFTTIGFAMLFLKSEEKTNFEYFLLFLFLLISLATGSRGVLVGISLVFVLRYGFSSRNVIYAILSIILYFLVINLNFDTSLNRFSTQNLMNDRTLQYYYAFETFLQKPFSGWGLDKYAFIDKNLVPHHLKGYIISAHNGYLAVIVQYGLIFSALFFFIVFNKASSVLYYFRKPKVGYTVIYSFLIIYTLLASIYETLMTGINDFHTIMFWFALAVLSYSKISSSNAN
ncbi:MAG: O-antigen ligase family protein [Flavobacteriales bacterium]|nr:O-antigen ligase family protein [Flavobacteriales bacterium]